MNEKNLEYLKENLKYLGFGDKLYPELERNLQQGYPAFQLRMMATYNEEKMQVMLHFRKSESSDMIFLNRYDATLEKRNGEVLSQTFYIYKGSGITTKEAYNLLEGRSVYKELYTKEGEQYHAWLQLDFLDRDAQGNFKFKQFHDNYGFDLEATLTKFPIKEMQGEETARDIVLKSLQKGNLQGINMEKEGVSQRIFIEANPQFKTINLYDAHLQRIPFQFFAEKYGLSLADKKEKESPAGTDGLKQSAAEQANEQEKAQLQTKKKTRRQGLSL